MIVEIRLTQQQQNGWTPTTSQPEPEPEQQEQDLLLALKCTDGHNEAANGCTMERQQRRQQQQSLSSSPSLADGSSLEGDFTVAANYTLDSNGTQLDGQQQTVAAAAQLSYSWSPPTTDTIDVGEKRVEPQWSSCDVHHKQQQQIDPDHLGQPREKMNEEQSTTTAMMIMRMSQQQRRRHSDGSHAASVDSAATVVGSCDEMMMMSTTNKPAAAELICDGRSSAGLGGRSLLHDDPMDGCETSSLDARCELPCKAAGQAQSSEPAPTSSSSSACINLIESGELLVAADAFSASCVSGKEKVASDTKSATCGQSAREGDKMIPEGATSADEQQAEGRNWAQSQPNLSLQTQNKQQQQQQQQTKQHAGRARIAVPVTRAAPARVANTGGDGAAGRAINQNYAQLASHLRTRSKSSLDVAAATSRRRSPSGSTSSLPRRSSGGGTNSMGKRQQSTTAGQQTTGQAVNQQQQQQAGSGGGHHQGLEK